MANTGNLVLEHLEHLKRMQAGLTRSLERDREALPGLSGLEGAVARLE